MFDEFSTRFLQWSLVNSIQFFSVKHCWKNDAIGPWHTKGQYFMICHFMCELCLQLSEWQDMMLLKPNCRSITLVFEETKFYFQYLYGKNRIHNHTTVNIQRAIQAFLISKNPLFMKEQILMVHTQKGQKQKAWRRSQNIYFIFLCQGKASSKKNFE